MAKEKKRGLAAEEKFIRTHDPDPHVRILTAGGPSERAEIFPKRMQTIGLPAFKRLQALAIRRPRDRIGTGQT